MKPARILIVEDKSVIAESLALTLEHAGYSIAGKAVSGEQALDFVEKEVPDVILMDIHLAGKIDGVQTAEQLKLKFSIPVIYITDFHDEATIERAKHTRPAAYLVKPYKEKDLLITIELAFYNSSSGEEAKQEPAQKTGESIFPLSDRFFVKEKDVLYRIDIADILWVEADRSYSIIKTKNKDYIISQSLRVLADKLTDPVLLRVSRSHVVNIDKITAIKGNVLMIDEAEITVGKDYRDDVHRRFQRI